MATVMQESSYYHAHMGLKGDGTTIVYDVTKPNRSDAVGKAYKRLADGTHALVEDGDEIDGIVLSVSPSNKFTGAYLFGGLFFLIGHGQTVTRGQRIIGALGPSSAKGYVKGVSVPSTLTTLAATDIDTDAEKLAVYNAHRTAINTLIQIEKSGGTIIDFDTTRVLVQSL